MCCNDCLRAAKTKTRSENKRERNKIQEKKKNQQNKTHHHHQQKNTQQITLLAFLYGLELELRTEVSKVPQTVLDAVFQVVGSWGWLHDEGFWESAEGHTSTYPGEEGHCVWQTASLIWADLEVVAESWSGTEKLQCCERLLFLFLQDAFNQLMQLLGGSLQKTVGRKRN